jgi:four helix bundle protein
MLSLNHKNLDVWKKSIKLVSNIYKLTDNFPKKEIYGLTGQIRRAAISIPSNIAEGAARKSGLERKRFFEIARSSLVEVDTQLEIAINLEYLDSKNIDELEKQIIDVFSMISNLIKSTK